MSLRVAAASACIVTGAFHVRLLAGQFLDGDLSDPGRMVRWLIAGGVTALLVVLARRGESLVGRKAMAVWALAAILHGPVLADAPVSGVASLPETAIALVQITVAGATLGLLVFGAIARDAARLPAVQIGAGWPLRWRLIACGVARPFAARPPPRR